MLIWLIPITASNTVNILQSQIMVIIPLKCFILRERLLLDPSSKKKGNKDGKFNGPHYCQSTKKDLLMVCDERNHRVQVFELSGKFVTKFGSKGSKSGEFRNPVCTANIGDGRIVVCDTNNSRIQLFDYE